MIGGLRRSVSLEPYSFPGFTPIRDSEVTCCDVKHVATCLVICDEVYASTARCKVLGRQRSSI